MNKIKPKISVHGKICKEINGFIEKIRILFYKNATLCSLAFIIIYMIEQLLLVHYAPNLNYIISMFIIIFLTTIAVEKALMETRNSNLKSKINEYIKEKELEIIKLRAENGSFKTLIRNLVEELPSKPRR